jgi:hypothetical protein
MGFLFYSIKQGKDLRSYLRLLPISLLEEIKKFDTSILRRTPKQSSLFALLKEMHSELRKSYSSFQFNSVVYPERVLSLRDSFLYQVSSFDHTLLKKCQPLVSIYASWTLLLRSLSRPAQLRHVPEPVVPITKAAGAEELDCADENASADVNRNGVDDEPRKYNLRARRRVQHQQLPDRVRSRSRTRRVVK